MVRIGKVQAVERSMLRNLMGEHHLAQTGMIDSATLKKLGKVFSADGVVTGSFINLGQKAVVNARLINVETGAIIAAVERKVEVFTAGCPVCDEAVKTVKAAACPSCEVVVYDLNKGCETNECRLKAKEYGIERVPAVAVNGKLLDCCKDGAVDAGALRAAGIGQP